MKWFILKLIVTSGKNTYYNVQSFLHNFVSTKPIKIQTRNPQAADLPEVERVSECVCVCMCVCFLVMEVT